MECISGSKGKSSLFNKGVVSRQWAVVRSNQTTNNNNIDTHERIDD